MFSTVRSFTPPKPPKAPTGARATTAAENQAGYAAGARAGTSILKDPNSTGAGWEYASNIYNRDDEDYDVDLYRAALMQRYLRGEGGMRGDVENLAGAYNPDSARAAMNKYLAQAGLRKEAKGQLKLLPGQQMQDELHVKQDAEQAIGQGVKSTRQNFNQRGLLYGGMREGGEGQVKAQGAATLANNLSGVKRDYANRADALKTSIAQTQLAQQQETMRQANAVAESNMRNSVARQQAYQQLGEGVGYAAGSYYGGSGGGSNANTSAGNSGMTSSSSAARYIRPEVY